MTHFSTYIGQAALQSFFPHLSNKQNAAYNPQYNGWDSVDDMPKYTNTNKNKAYAEYLKEGQKLNAQLIEQVFKTEKLVPKKKNQALPNYAKNQNIQNNQQYYNKPTPYNYAQQTVQPIKNMQTQYHNTNYLQKQINSNQTMYPNPNNNQNYPYNAIHQTSYQNQNQNQNQIKKPQNLQTNNIKNNQNTQNNQNNQNNFQRKISAQEMDAILSS